MPKIIDINVIIWEFGGSRVWVHDPEKKSLTCKLCSVSINYKRRNLLVQHVRTAKHQKHFGLMTSNYPLRAARPDFTMDLIRMMIACNIPLTKARQPAFVQFIEKHCGQSLPSRFTLTKCMEATCREMISKIKGKLKGQELFVQADKTRGERPLIVIMAGPLDGASLETPFLLDLSEASEENSLEVAVLRALIKVFGEDMDFNKVRLLITSGDSLNVGERLKSQFPNLLHITCLSDVLTRLAELVRHQFPRVDVLVSALKKVFSPEQEEDQREALVWLEAACYYFDNYDRIKAIVDEEDRRLFQDEELFHQLSVIKTHFHILVSTIKALQERIPLIQSVQLIENVQSALHQRAFSDKLKALLQESPSYDKVLQMAKVLSGSEYMGAVDATKDSISYMANAPLVTCDVERLFAALKDVHTPKRGNLSESHIKDILLIQWNFKLKSLNF